MAVSVDRASTRTAAGRMSPGPNVGVVTQLVTHPSYLEHRRRLGRSTHYESQAGSPGCSHLAAPSPATCGWVRSRPVLRLLDWPLSRSGLADASHLSPSSVNAPPGHAEAQGLSEYRWLRSRLGAGSSVRRSFV